MGSLDQPAKYRLMIDPKNKGQRLVSLSLRDRIDSTVVFRLDLYVITSVRSVGRHGNVSVEPLFMPSKKEVVWSSTVRTLHR